MSAADFPIRIRPELLAIPAYRQGKQAPAGAFKLSSNENPYPALPSVRKAIADYAEINRYPDPAHPELREILAKKFGVTEHEVLLGAGSVSLLTALLGAVGSGGEIVYSWRSFEAYPIISMIAGASSIQIPNTFEHKHDLAAMAAAVTEKTRAIILCSPNNPTGTVITAAEFEGFMAKVPADILIILDEAYFEFVRDEDAVNGENYLGKYPNLVVLRTFSKAYGLAGLRIGYAIGDAKILRLASFASVPLSVTGLAASAAVASLQAEDELLERVQQIVATRQRLLRGCGLVGMDVPTSQANYIWLPTAEKTDAAEALFLQNAIVVRNLVDGIRVTVAEPESVDNIIDIVAELVQG